MKIVAGLVELIGGLVSLLKDLSSSTLPRKLGWGPCTFLALIISAVVAAVPFELTSTLLASKEIRALTTFWFVFLPLLFVLLDLLWKPWPKWRVWRRQVPLAVPLSVLWLSVGLWLVPSLIGVDIPRIPISDQQQPTPEPLQILFDDRQQFGTWEFGSTPDNLLPAGIMESGELENEDCYEEIACIVLGNPREYSSGQGEAIPVAQAWATWTPPSSGLPKCAEGSLNLVFWWRMVTWDVLEDAEGNQGDYFEVVVVLRDGTTASTKFARQGNPTSGTSSRRHDMDWYNKGKYRCEYIDLTTAFTSDAVAVRFTTANTDFPYSDNHTYDLYNTYTLIDNVYLACKPR